jgi:hypothetical protein
MTRTVPSPNVAITRMLNEGHKVNAREVEAAAQALEQSGKRIREMERTLDETGAQLGPAGRRNIEQHLAAERYQLGAAVDVLERIGRGDRPFRQPDSEDLLTALERAQVTPKARGVAARHGALLRAVLDARATH